MTLSLQTTDYVINRPDIVFLHEIDEANNLLQSTWDIVTTSLSDGMTFTNSRFRTFKKLKILAKVSPSSDQEYSYKKKG